MTGRITSLSIHADYRCRHSGRCCSMHWDVPIELPIYRTLDAAVRAGTLQVSTEATGLAPFVVEPDMPEDTAAIFERTDDGRCVFFERGPNLCIVHRDLGESALAATCKHFPRLAVADTRGTAVTLSHFCPTAASMLFRDDVPVTIVEQPPAFPLRDYDGLTVGADDLPPLLTPTTLMDPEGYDAWERHMVMRCADLSRRPESVLATLARDAALLGAWRPGRVSLVEAVWALPTDVEEVDAVTSLGPSLERYHEVLASVPDAFRPDADTDGLEAAFEAWVREAWDGFRAPLVRYVAGKAFASWTAYQGRGVATIVRGLEAALALVRVEAARQCRTVKVPLSSTLLLEAFREADFLLNHLAVGEELAIRWSSAEARR